MIILGTLVMFLLGTVTASSLLTFFWRQRQGKKWTNGRSVCDYCEARLPTRALLPMIGFFLMKQCMNCKRSSPTYSMITEILVGLAWAFIWLTFPRPIGWAPLMGSLVIITTLLTIAIIDFYFMEIPVSFVWAGIFIISLLFFVDKNRSPSIVSAVLGACITLGFFLWQYVLSRGQWIGGGDIWIGAFLGFVFGWSHVIIVVAAGYGLAAFVSFVRVFMFPAKKYNLVPLGGFLCLSGTLFFLFDLL